MVRGAGDLRGQPNGGSTLLFQFRLDALANVYVVDFCHKKSVELIPCLNIRVSTPYSSNKLFHAVSLRHWQLILDEFCPQYEDVVEI